MTSVIVGLTGGIGAGKSTVASLFAGHGATVIDVDAVGRHVLDPDGGAYSGVIDRFGSKILAADGTIDRARLAAEVFGAGNRLGELEAVSHPAINEVLADRVAEHREGALVLDMAVLVESSLGVVDGAALYQRVVVVEAAIDTRIDRLTNRGLTAPQARERMAAQASDHERRAVADLVIDNDGDQARLETVVRCIWPSIEAWTQQGRTQ